MLNALKETIISAQSVVLCTHRNCDGDGLGSQISLYLALKKMGKRVQILNVDRAPKKYSFLNLDNLIDVYVPGASKIESFDLCLILDTNDERLVEPLFSALKESCKQICFIDHHPVLKNGPLPAPGSVIDESAASTGELCYAIIKKLGISFDAPIARALYTALVFDTQLFRFVKSNPASHLMAAELLKFERNPEEVHRHLFSNYSVLKFSNLMHAMSKVEYLSNDRLAFIPLRVDSLLGTSQGLDRDESGDVIDHVMSVGSIELAALLREDGPNSFKLSLRSRGKIEVLNFAENLGGGGHRFAAGAYLTGHYEDLRRHLIQTLEELLESNASRKLPRKSGT